MVDPLHIVTRERREAGLSVILGVQVVIMFVVAPLSATGWLTPEVGAAFRFGLAAAAVLTIIRSRLIILLVIGSFVLSVTIGWLLRSDTAQSVIDLARIAITCTFYAAVAASVARTVFGPGDVTVQRILGGVILYLSMGLIFADLYRASELLLTPSFSGVQADNRGAMAQLLYYSLGTLTTAGAAGMAPIHPFVRSLSNLESVVGALYPPVLLGRLVTLHVARGLDERFADHEDGDAPQSGD